MIDGKSKRSFWEKVRGKFHSSLHVSFDFHFTLHECGLWVKLSSEKINGI
jgi:hypothetical protein